ASLETGHYGVFAVAFFVAGLTAFYLFRIYFVTFWGPHRGHGAEHAHEAPVVMLLPLLVLAGLSIVAGFVPMGDYVSIGAHAEHHGGINWAVAGPAVGIGVLGIALAAFLYAGAGAA